MKDLFEKPARVDRLPHGKMGELARFILAEGHAKTSDVARWGCDHFYVSAVRAACLLAEKELLRRLSDAEAEELLGYEGGQGVWVPTDLLRRLCDDNA